MGLVGHGTFDAAFEALPAARADAVSATVGLRPEISGVPTRSRGDFDAILEDSDLIGGVEPAVIDEDFSSAMPGLIERCRGMTARLAWRVCPAARGTVRFHTGATPRVKLQRRRKVTVVMRARCSAAAIAASAALAVMAGAPPTSATVPPKNCGITKVGGKRYQVKADQMRCSAATSYARRYLGSHQHPSGYRCADFGSSTKLKFRCAKGVRVFLAIKR